MERIDNLLKRLATVVRMRMLLIAAVLGLGICRGCLGWVLQVSRDMDVSSILGMVNVHSTIVIGEIVGFAIYMVLIRFTDGAKHGVGLLLVPGGIYLAGCMVLVVALSAADASASNDAIVVGTGFFLASVGFGMCCSQWLELCGLSSPKEALEIIAFSYALSTVIWFMSQDLPLWHIAVCLICSLLLSVFLLAACWVRGSFGERITFFSPKRGLTSDSWYIVLWAAALLFAYGIGDSLTGLGYSTDFYKLGAVLPVLVLVAGMAALRERFELNALYCMILPLMIAGLLGASLFPDSGGIFQTLMSSAQTGCNILVLTMLCADSHHRGVSCVDGCALANIGMLSFCMVGENVGNYYQQDALQIVVVVVLVLLTVIFIAFLAVGRTRSILTSFQTGSSRLQEALLDVIADDAGLSVREKTVFGLLVQGRDAPQIASELFISQGAVRSHISRIYGKFDVHSRQELTDELDRRMAAGVSQLRIR